MTALPLQQQPQTTRLASSVIEGLHYMAFSGQYEAVHAIFKRMNEIERSSHADKYIFHQAIWGGIMKLRKLLSVQDDDAAQKEKDFIDSVLRMFIADCQLRQVFPRELFQAILFWSEELIALVLPDEALDYIHAAMSMGGNKFPEVHSQLQSRMAQILADRGRMGEAREILAEMAERPYLITDRNAIPEILFNFSRVALLTGDVDYYKKLLFLGLRHFYTNLDQRRRFVDQLCITYRRFYRLLLHREVGPADKILFLIHWLYYRLPDFRRIFLGGINRLLRLGILGYVYLLNYLTGDAQVDPPGKTARLQLPALSEKGDGRRNGKTAGLRLRRRDILITRAMGGIGDLLMMTPGIHALKQKFPDDQIFLAIPKRYFPVFQNNMDVVLVDIEKQNFDYSRFRRWYNFTDCPAARVESRTAPKVKKSRQDIFARALGVRGLRLMRMDRRPRYWMTEEECAFRDEFFRLHHLQGRPVVGIQLHADETYRDYPRMEQLARILARHAAVLVFDARPIEGFDIPNVIKVDSLNMRQAFSLVSRCDLVIAPDSAFVHLTAAMDVPCVAIFGPIDGKVRTRHYPRCQYVDARSRLGCVSCWRNENIPCKLTEMRESVCMRDVTVPQVLAAVRRGLPGLLPAALEAPHSFPAAASPTNGKPNGAKETAQKNGRQAATVSASAVDPHQ